MNGIKLGIVQSVPLPRMNGMKLGTAMSIQRRMLDLQPAQHPDLQNGRQNKDNLNVPISNKTISILNKAFKKY